MLPGAAREREEGVRLKQKHRRPVLGAAQQPQMSKAKFFSSCAPHSLLWGRNCTP